MVHHGTKHILIWSELEQACNERNLGGQIETMPHGCTDRLAQLTSEVNLYKALGGGWSEQTAKNEPLKEEAPALKLF